MTATPVHSTRRNPGRPSIFLVALAVLGGVVMIGFFVLGIVFESYAIEGPAMEPGYAHGDRVLANAMSGTPAVGDVIIVEGPDAGFDVMKRVVGVGGDRIELRDGVIVRNGEPVPQREVARHESEGAVCFEETLGQKPYRIERAIDGRTSTEPEVTVPEGHVYVIGDHRDRSNDSRYFGPVPVDKVKGRVVATYWHGDDPSPCASDSSGE